MSSGFQQAQQFLKPKAFKYCKLTCQFATARTHFLAVSPDFLKTGITFVWHGIFCSNSTQLQYLCYIFILFRICVEIKKNCFQVPFSSATIFNDRSKNSNNFWNFFRFPVVKYVRKKGAKFHDVSMNSFQHTWI